MNNKKEHKLSSEAQAVWERLDEETKSGIQKSNPYKLTRNEAIRRLIKGKGLRVEIVKEISGLNTSTIYRILAQGDYLPDYAREDVRGLVKSFQDFISSLTVVLGGKHKKGERRIS